MLFGIFGPSSGTSVGLDIGTSHVKAVGLKNCHKTKPRLMGLSIVPTPAGAVTGGAILDVPALKRTITEAFEVADISISNQNITVGLGGLNVLCKKIVMPLQNASEMSDQILREAQQYIDSDIAAWTIDYQILTEKDAQGQVEVMLVAGRKGIIEDIGKLISELGARPVIFDYDVFAMMNIHEHRFSSSKQNILFVDIGKGA